jgi:hypothetical protein
MRLYAKIYPEYFEMLDTKLTEFRQIESILLENSQTHETREFAVKDIRKCERVSAEHVQKMFPLVPWNEKLPVFAIELGDEISVLPERSTAELLEDRNNIHSVHAGAEILKMDPDRKQIEYEKPWYVVGD